MEPSDPQAVQPRLTAYRWLVMLYTLLLSVSLTLFSIYILGEYGLLLFFFIPVFMGIFPVILLGRKKKLTSGQAHGLGLQALGLYVFVLLFFAIEGLICIVMLLPFAVILVLIGSAIARAIIDRNGNNGPATLLILAGMAPLLGFVDKNTAPQITSVTTVIEIDAAPETVWKNVVAFPQLGEPEEFIFKAGIAYPINATIKGEGRGAIRYCNFTTGSFVEPITVWDEPRLLKFDVKEQPEPMKELSFYDIDAPHLHDYFVSKRGQFRLTKLPNGKTLLEGTTWYYHNIKPASYWKLWSNYIVHKIHYRVLEHIKKNSEGS